MAVISAPFPVREPMTDAQRIVSEPWRIWLRDLSLTVDQQPVLTNPSVSLTAKTASIATTPFNTGTLAAGIYRVSFYAAVTTAAGVSSSLIVTASWTENGNAKSRSSAAAMTGNTITTNQSEVWPIHISASSPVSYATTYASNPAAAMAYSLYLVLETVSV